ncbi:MAG: hypothetical protein QOE26_1662 [Verrucomicrobiota bacterium]
MPNDANPTAPEVQSDDTASEAGGKGPGSKLSSVGGIIGLTSYLVVTILFCLYGLIVFWPTPTPAGPSAAQTAGPPKQIDSTTRPSTSPSPSPTSSPLATVAGTSSQSSPSPSPSATPGKASAFGYEFEIWDEVRLLWIVILAGALGSLIHAVRSVYWYVGNRNLVDSWMAKYFVMPFTGSALSVVFYFVIRGGFFSPQSQFSQTSPFGFAAMAALVGLFSEQAILKLKQIAETVFTKPEQGADPMPPTPPPTLTPTPKPPLPPGGTNPSPS